MSPLWHRPHCLDDPSPPQTFLVILIMPTALDTIIGIQGDGFVMLAADPVLHRSLIVMQKASSHPVGVLK